MVFLGDFQCAMWNFCESSVCDLEILGDFQCLGGDFICSDADWLWRRLGQNIVCFICECEYNVNSKPV